MNDIVNTWIFKINEYIVNFSSFFPLGFIISLVHTHHIYIYIYILLLLNIKKIITEDQDK